MPPPVDAATVSRQVDVVPVRPTPQVYYQCRNET